MRKNLAKHAAKKLPLAKRVLALCFALIFVCSCLLPAFANGADADFTEDTPAEVEEVAEPVDVVSEEPTDTADDGLATLDDDFGVATLDEDFGVATLDEGFGVDDSFGVDDGAAALDDSFGVDDGVSALDENPISQPVGGIDLPIAIDPTPVVDGDDTPKEGAVNVTTDKDGNIVYEYDTSDVTFDDDFVVSQPDGDHALDKVDAAFAIPTNTYRFWLSEKDSYDLAEIARDAAAADLTEDEYLRLHGESKGLFHLMYVADGGNFADYKFTSPTSVDDPSGNSRTFAGWYTIDELGDKHDFKFDDFLYTSKSQTVDVYAKWEEDNTPVDVSNKVEVDDSGTTLTVKVKAMPKDTKSLSVSLLDDDAMESFYEVYVGSLSDESDAMMPLIGFNITPRDNSGSKIQPTEAVTVTISDLSNIGLENGENLKVLHQTASGVEMLDAEYSNGTLTFETKSFSNFVIAGEVTPDIDDGGIETMSIYAPDDTLVAGNSMRLVSDHGGRAASSQTGWTTSTAFIRGKCSWSVAPESMDLITISGDTTGSNPTYTDGRGSGSTKSNLYSESVTVTAKKNVSGTARIIHDFSYIENGRTITKREIRTIRIVNEAQTGHWVYLYVQVRNDTYGIMKNLVSNVNGWFTIGKVFVSDIGAPSVDGNKSYSSTGGYRTGSSDKGDNSDWKALMEQDSTGKWIIKPSLTVERYTENLSVNLDDIVWDNGGTYIENGQTKKGQISGLVSSDGAADYATSSAQRSPDEGNAETWHLDGCLDLSNYGMVTINHWVVQGDEKIIHDTDFTFGKAGELVYEKTYQRVSVTMDNEEYLYSSHDVEYQEVEAGKNKIINIYYEKNVPKANVTITKQVTGLLGDRLKAFTFKVEVLDQNMLPIDGYTVEPAGTNLNEFTLKHNQSITLKDVPIGATIRVTETAPGEHYDVTATGYDTKISGTTNAVYEYIVGANTSAEGLDAEPTATNYVTAPNNDIVVTNECTIEPDMGVLLDTLPYILILGVVVGGAVLLFVRKRKHDDE